MVDSTVEFTWNGLKYAGMQREAQFLVQQFVTELLTVALTDDYLT